MNEGYLCVYPSTIEGESVPPIPDFEELGLDPAAAIPHCLLHLRLHREHLVLRDALLAPHLRIRLQPRPRPAHLHAGLPSAPAAQIGGVGAATFHLHRQPTPQPRRLEKTPLTTPQNRITIQQDRRKTLTSLKHSMTKTATLGAVLAHTLTSIRLLTLNPSDTGAQEMTARTGKRH